MANKVYILIIILLTAGIFAYIGWGENQTPQGIELQITASPYSMQQSLERVKTALGDKNIPITAEISVPQSDIASDDIQAYLLILDIPEAGEVILQNIESAAMLPLKIILWKDAGQTKLAFAKPEEIAKHYNLDMQKAKAVSLKLKEVTAETVK
ncbi:MAG: DUF302 domain-containing protein [Elusimicrobiaceae bacterium]